MNKSITSALRYHRKSIIHHVEMTDLIDMGSRVVKITRQGKKYSDYRSLAEIRRMGREDHFAFKDTYLCDPDVPAEIQEILA